MASSGKVSKKTNKRPNPGRRKKRPSGKLKAKIKKLIKKIWKKNKAKILFLFTAILLIFILIRTHGQNTYREDAAAYSGYIHNAKFADHIALKGIDVSYAQGDNINWKDLKRSGVDFVFIRAGYRDAGNGSLHTDMKFKQNVDGAEKSGMMIGLYFYSQAISSKEAIEEANYISKLAKGKKIALPLVMDYEFYNGGRLAKAVSSGNIRRSDLSRFANEFCRQIEANDYEAMIYANLDFLNNYLGVAGLMPDTKIWLAQYHNFASYRGNYNVWQFTDRGKLDGITKNVDLDFMYFNPDEIHRTKIGSKKKAMSIEYCNVQLAKHSTGYLRKIATPKINVYLHGVRLKENRDYLVSYIKNTEPGTGYAIVTGIGNYKDTITTSFKIRKLF